MARPGRDGARPRVRGARRAALLVLAVSAGVMAAMTAAQAATPSPTPSAAPPPPSGIGQRQVLAIRVSPAYSRTGLVVVQAMRTATSPNKNGELWISHDGGATWSEVPASGWNGGYPSIAVDRTGKEALFAGSGAGLQRSTDYGLSWSTVAPGDSHVPTPSSNYSADQTLAVAAAKDYLYRPNGVQAIAGSSGAYQDYQFAFSPRYPAASSHAPVLLSASDKNGVPYVERCDGSFVCSRPTALPGGLYAAPVTLQLSSGFGDDGVVYAQSNRFIYKSADGGGTFAPVNVVSTQGASDTNFLGLALAPGYMEAGPVRSVYVAVFQAFVPQPGASASSNGSSSSGGIYASDDAGTTWRRLGPAGSPLHSGATAVGAAPDGRLFAGYLQPLAHALNYGLLCSSDHGTTWQATCAPMRRTATSQSSGAAAGSRTPSSPNSTCAGGPCQAVLSSAGAAGDSPAPVAVSTTESHAARESGLVGQPWLVAGLLVVVAAAGGSGFLALRGRRYHPFRR